MGVRTLDITHYERAAMTVNVVKPTSEVGLWVNLEAGAALTICLRPSQDEDY